MGKRHSFDKPVASTATQGIETSHPESTARVPGYANENIGTLSGAIHGDSEALLSGVVVLGEKRKIGGDGESSRWTGNPKSFLTLSPGESLIGHAEKFAEAMTLLPKNGLDEHAIKVLSYCGVTFGSDCGAFFETRFPRGWFLYAYEEDGSTHIDVRNSFDDLKGTITIQPSSANELRWVFQLADGAAPDDGFLFPEA